VAAVERFGEPEHGCQRPYHCARLARQLAVAFMMALRRAAAMVAGDQRHDLNFGRFETAQVTIGEEVKRVLVMIFVADVHADVVEQRRVLQPLALLVGECVHTAGFLEQGQGKTGNLVGMVRPEVAPLPELDHASPPDVRVALRLGDLLAMAGNVVEDQPLTQRKIA
jgi:hypothetical protein